MKPKVYFRADGGAKMGLGHIIRCMALAQMLSDDFEITFVCKEIPEDNANELTGLGFGLISIKNEDDFLTRLVPDVIVVLDHYGLDSGYQKFIKEKGSKLVCIDDLHDKVFFADLIINHAPGVVPADYRAQSYTQFALGLDYVLLRPAFLNKARENETVSGSITTVFVCLGGADIKNITQTAVNVLKPDLRFNKIIIVTGASYRYLNGLRQSVKNDKRFFLYHSVNSKVMSGLIAGAQLAIVSSSGILQEVIAVGCKVISGMYVENQKYIFDNYKALGAFESAEDFSTENIKQAIELSFKNEKAASRRFIDGCSNKRLLSVFTQLLKEDLIILRKADKDDLIKTFEWAANAGIRKFSFNNIPVTFEDHKKWFFLRMEDKKCFYFLGLFNNEAFGSVRFEIENTEAKISYLIDPAFQKNGLGTILLKKGLSVLAKQVPENVSSVWGEVIHENYASVKVFKKLGYTEELDPLTGIIKFRKLL